MHPALRSSLAILAIVACIGCQTPDRRMYSIHRDKNLHTPNPWAPSTTKAAEDATASLGLPPDSMDSTDSPDSTGPAAPPATPAPPAPSGPMNP
jgi:hypothetical protein